MRSDSLEAVRSELMDRMDQLEAQVEQLSSQVDQLSGDMDQLRSVDKVVELPNFLEKRKAK
jgi:outer membrane murein-binding lipoprotein Lpp